MADTSAPDPLERFFDDLVRCETRLYNATGETLRSEHGIATSQFEYLRYLRAHPESRVADVAANFAAGIGAISKGIDRLQSRGLIARHPNPADGRSSLVSLTTAGADLLRDAEATFRLRLSELVGTTLGAAEVETASRVLHALRDALERDRVGLPVG